MNWTIITEDYKSFPPEGEDVIVSDGEICDVAYYLKSGEYKWMKIHKRNYAADKFKSFIPIKWMKLPSL